MNKQAVWAIAAKDMRAIANNLQVWLPMAVVPVIVAIVVPLVLIVAITHSGPSGGNGTDQLVAMLSKLAPSQLKATLNAMPSLAHQIAYLAANYEFAPFFLLIPLVTATSISADSFAGEKERSTLESLLFAPVDLASLFVSKVLAGFIPAVALSVGTFVLCAVAVNIAGRPLFHAVFFPRWNWLPLMLLVIPMVALLSILVTVFVSMKATTFQGAYQSSAMMVLPMLLLLVGQAAGLMLLDTGLVTVIGLALALINGLILWQMVRRTDRARLFETQIK